MAEKNTPNVKRDEWDAEKIAEEASVRMEDEISREISRGDETKGDADERDIVGGGPDSKDTAYGREEAKTRAEGGAS